MPDLRKIFKYKKTQSQLNKEVEQITALKEEGNVSVVVRGDKRIVSIIVDGVENKRLRDLINDTMKILDKKIEKQLRGRSEELMDMFK
ncbi:hypothetical protein A3H26_00375 [candidate division WWE3 bacterium RIFCSPLOWO2_12_FULL_36_10]|uniref:Nucleoid-associated protein, YbaB/EbfC family n=1 Tax=candidate division WWE3 bacterium RIFCSPLOWO2_12_FULL_36_10 TaxID=1802630 RepID=A0A1F4VGK7_UNCKA|nr:MAG: hypothetical protein A3H26_00375 [candidate division WWE3 bacterium RIFCSPLOWO2_12_FULL_36_10]